MVLNVTRHCENLVKLQFYTNILFLSDTKRLNKWIIIAKITQFYLRVKFKSRNILYNNRNSNNKTKIGLHALSWWRCTNFEHYIELDFRTGKNAIAWNSTKSSWMNFITITANVQKEHEHVKLLNGVKKIWVWLIRLICTLLLSTTNIQENRMLK